MTVQRLNETGRSGDKKRRFRTVESIEEGLRDERLQQVSFALG